MANEETTTNEQSGVRDVITRHQIAMSMCGSGTVAMGPVRLTTNSNICQVEAVSFINGVGNVNPR